MQLKSFSNYLEDNIKKSHKENNIDKRNNNRMKTMLPIMHCQHLLSLLLLHQHAKPFFTLIDNNECDGGVPVGENKSVMSLQNKKKLPFSKCTSLDIGVQIFKFKLLSM